MHTYNHNSSVYNNSLLKVPIHPIVGQPLPRYEQDCNYHVKIQNKKKLSTEIQEMSKKKYLDKETTESFMEFFNDIPDYHEVNHLSNNEFYKQLESIKLKKKIFEENLHKEIKFDPDTRMLEDYKKEKLTGTKNKNKTKKKPSLKPFSSTTLTKSLSQIRTPDLESELSDKEDKKKSTLKPYFKHLRPALTPDFDSEFSDKDISIKTPSRRSVRIETPSDKFSDTETPELLSRSKSRASQNVGNLTDWEDFTTNRRCKNNGNTTDWEDLKTKPKFDSDWQLSKSRKNTSRPRSRINSADNIIKDSNWSNYRPKSRVDKEEGYKPKLKPNFSCDDLKRYNNDTSKFQSRTFSSLDLKYDNNEDWDNLKPKFEDSRPKSRINDTKMIDWDDMSIENLNLNSDCYSPEPLRTRSAPSTPTKFNSKMSCNNGGITIPKPFQMTVRDEENKIVEDLYTKIKKPKEEKPEMFKAHDVPIESQIPLFDQILAEQQRRSLISKQKRKASLRAQMKPFSFTKRDEEIQELTRELSKSTPNLYYDPPLKIKKFKAKPIPRNLFSNYIYRKMHEDEYYRALQKKIRAEELLKAASLPPSMAKREKTKPKLNVCPRSYSTLSNKEDKPLKKTKNVPDYKIYHDKYEKELEELKNEFISTSPRPFKLKTSKRGRRNLRQSSASSKSSSSKTATSSSCNMSSINTSNLAAVLRIQSARNKLEMEMVRKLEELQLKEEMRWREKLFRKKPIWQILAYSHEEDLAMRLRLRRDEEKLRSEEHKMRMQLMYGRVQQQPTLFERQSQVKYPKTQEELKDHLRQIYGKAKRHQSERSISNLSNKRLGNINYMDNYNLDTEESYRSKEKESTEEKEKCDCLSDNDIDNDKLV